MEGSHILERRKRQAGAEARSLFTPLHPFTFLLASRRADTPALILTLNPESSMRIAYLDCASGIAGDMMLAALIDAGAELAAIQAGVVSLGLPNVQILASETKRKGFRATKVDIHFEPEHKHRHLHHITEMIDAGMLTPQAKVLAKKIFTRLGEAEAKVHGVEIRKVHFHEVGAVDSIADIVGSAIGLDLLGIERIEASPVPTGHGFISIAHGRCSIPAPATAELLTGIPLAPSTVEAELTTPTGAAILAALASNFGPLPAMTVRTIGYGAGTKEFDEQPNILRLVVGESTAQSGKNSAIQSETLSLLETNLDDVSGELVGYCLAQLFEAGALDVFTTAIQMKKNRPGVVLSVLCHPADAERLESIVFRETTTLGIRRTTVDRSRLQRTPHQVTTAFGIITGQLVTPPDGSVYFAPEYEACARVAEMHKVPLRVVFDAALRAFLPS
jgi:pyridinium-3,5-bisthiocarboxylic acid mononucleotide nickel chelatase